MTKNFLLLFFVFFCVEQACAKKKEPVQYVNPFIGASTAQTGNFAGLGKTFPGAATPFGMVQVSPNTITGGDNGSGYYSEHNSIEGFAMTQMSGVGWYGDLGNFLVMPTTGKLKTSAGSLDKPDVGYRSRYSTEKASAGYYSVVLDDYQVKAEMSATTHAGIFQFTFPENSQSRIQIDLARRVGGTSTLQNVKVVDEHTITGWMKCPPEGGGWGNGAGKADYTVYFYAQFSKPITDFGIWSADIPDDWSRKREDIESARYQQQVANADIFSNKKEMTGKHLGFFTQFETQRDEVVILKTGISFVSVDGAKKNLEAEISGWNFDRVHRNAVHEWNKALGKMEVEGGTDEEKKIFYTALYHTLIDPRIFTDVDGNYVGGDSKIHHSDSFVKRTIFSGWDVFRSQFPLQTLINPNVVDDMINSLVELADENLERWEFLNAYSGCMVGNPAISVIYDAYAKGIRGFNIPKAYQYAVNTSELFGNGDDCFSPGSISNTLEYAYTEWCMSQWAVSLGKKSDEIKYSKRAQSYRTIFDPTVGWFRPKNQDGSWQAWPAEGRMKEGYGSEESNPYQQGWFVPHDVPGMADLMGGNQNVLADLTNFFEKVPENMMWNDYYNHSNEPVHHVPYLFNRLGVPWLTQKWTREICQRAYHNSVDGLVGNEDVGQMSAWYVLAATGLAQLCPGDTRYEITSPVFSKITIQLDNKYTSGKKFTIIAHHNSSKNRYIQAGKLNGDSFNQCFLDYRQIASGGILELKMGPTPNKNWGILKKTNQSRSKK